jgi:hypothetical protein
MADLERPEGRMTRNDITGDRIASKPANDAFRNAFDRIFGKSSQCGDCCPTDDGPEKDEK